MFSSYRFYLIDLQTHQLLAIIDNRQENSTRVGLFIFYLKPWIHDFNSEAINCHNIIFPGLKQ